jgi:SH3 domain-containing YSC84-like protein 1
MSIQEYMRRHTRWAAMAALLAAASAPILMAAANDRQDDIDRVNSAARVFSQIMAVPDKAIPDSVIGGAHCLAIIPGEKTFALGIGGSYGKGVASCRKADGAWGAPLFISLGGGSWGAQIGGESSDIIMVFRSRSGLDSMLSDKFRIGAGASAAAGPVGRDAEAATDAKLNAEILTYARAKGAFAGIDLNGAVLQADDSANQRLYGNGVDKAAVLNGSVAAPAWASPLLTELDRNHVTH